VEHAHKFRGKRPNNWLVLPMFTISREIDFCYGHRLIGYSGKCRYLHGHNGRVVITLATRSLDQRGMVADFGDIKRIVSAWIDKHLDHRMILHKDDPAVQYLKQLGEPVVLLDVNPTAENIAILIAQYAQSQGLPVRQVQLWETSHCVASYCPGENTAHTISMVEVSAGPDAPAS